MVLSVMTDEQFEKLMTEIIQIESNTSGSKDAGFNIEDLDQKLDKIIELLERIALRVKRLGD
jgi:hypothetical protein